MLIERNHIARLHRVYCLLAPLPPFPEEFFFLSLVLLPGNAGQKSGQRGCGTGLHFLSPHHDGNEDCKLRRDSDDNMKRMQREQVYLCTQERLLHELFERVQHLNPAATALSPPTRQTHPSPHHEYPLLSTKDIGGSCLLMPSRSVPASFLDRAGLASSSFWSSGSPCSLSSSKWTEPGSSCASVSRSRPEPVVRPNLFFLGDRDATKSRCPPCAAKVSTCDQPHCVR